MAESAPTPTGRFRSAYGANPFHLIGTLAALALTTYTISVVGPSALWDPDVWWQSIIVWFLGAALVHDLVFFPLYALADRVIRRGVRATKAPRVTLNYLRIPLLAVGMLFLLFFPGIFQQGADSYLRATGQTQDPFLERWLLLSAAIFALSALAYACRLVAIRRSSGAPDR